MPGWGPTRAEAPASDRSVLIASMAPRSRRMADQSSMFLASHTVHVTTEANARPIMTACTSMSADMNIDQGDRSRGSWPMPMTESEGGAGCGAVAVGACEAVAGGNG